MQVEPDPVSAALQEAGRFGWLMYADKMDLREGKVEQVAARVADRARNGRRILVGALAMNIGILVPNAFRSMGYDQHGALGPIVGWTGLGMVVVCCLLLVPYLWRTYSRIERSLVSMTSSGRR